jgi:hypothetical protein
MRSTRRARLIVVAFVFAFAPWCATAQQAALAQGPLTSTLDRGAIDNLPSTANLFSLLETTQADTVSDRFFGGVNAGETGRLGVFLAPWSQTTFRIDDVDVTSPAWGGALFAPSSLVWQTVRVTSGLLPAATSGPGLLVALEPLRPPRAWSLRVDTLASREPLVSENAGLAPSIARPDAWTHATVTAGGSLGARAGVLVSAATTRASQFERGRPVAADQSADSVFSHVLVTPRDDQEVSTVLWSQATRGPALLAAPAATAGWSRRDVSSHAQSTWRRRAKTGPAWSLFGAFTHRVWHVAGDSPELLTIERLRDGPVSELVAPRNGGERRVSAGWRTSGVRQNALGLTHELQGGVDASHFSLTAEAMPPTAIGELVGGIPARMWDYAASGPAARHGTTVAVFVADDMQVSKTVTVEAGLRFDRTAGQADGAVRGITWNTLLPRTGVRWQASRRFPTAIYSAYAHTADALRLEVLGHGDPAAPFADVYRWDGSVGPRVSRVGPGAGPDGVLTTIDPSIERPITRELAFGIDTTLPHLPRLRATGVYVRRARSLALLNVGVPASSYDLSHVSDPGADLLAPVDDQMLPIYNRAPATFGRDEYLLSNTDASPATLRGLTLLVDRTTPRFFLGAGAAMGWTHGEAGNRGFGPTENDIGQVGEVMTDPNATTHARGNLFWDRQFTVRIATACKFAHDITVGAVARYQDGQAFSRMVVVPWLNQGTDAIRAFRSGKSRFTFTGTLDVRLQKGLTLPGKRRAVLFVDAFNVLNLGEEVEEWVVSGPAYRAPTAVQPPRTVHIGLRLTL